MDKAINIQRIIQVYKLLVALLMGEAAYQIERSKEDDVIEDLLMVANLMAVELPETLRYIGFLNPRDTVKEYVNMLFVLDTTFQVQYTNAAVRTLTGLDTETLQGCSFSSLMAAHSLETWKSIAQDLLGDLDYHAIHSLTFQMPDGLTKTSTCAISSVYTAALSVSFILITTFETSLRSLFLEEKFKKDYGVKGIARTEASKMPYILSNEMDIRSVQKVRDYILQNLELPLPNLRVLAHEFCLNEYKLKYGFNQLYGISVFRYLTQERLKRARLYLLNTSLPVKIIVKMVGFKNVSHFSKAFRKRYGMKPTDLRK